MRKSEILRFLVLSLCLGVLFFPASAQDETAESSVTLTDSFDAQLVSPVGNAIRYGVGDTFVIKVIAKQKIGIKSAAVRLAGEPSRLFEVDEGCSLAGQAKTVGGDELAMGAGEEIIVDCPIRPAKGVLNWVSAILSTAKPAQAILLIEKANETSSRWESDNLAFRVEPAPLSPLFGAFIGALLFALLVAIDRGRFKFKEILLHIGGAGIIATILIFALNLFSGEGALAMPIRVEITDFKGGVVVGLIAHLLRKQILERLTARSDSAADSKKG